LRARWSGTSLLAKRAGASSAVASASASLAARAIFAGIAGSNSPAVMRADTQPGR